MYVAETEFGTGFPVDPETLWILPGRGASELAFDADGMARHGRIVATPCRGSVRAWRGHWTTCTNPGRWLGAQVWNKPSASDRAPAVPSWAPVASRAARRKAKAG